ncbi:MAG: hypothetical protein EOP61_06240 [Sphingomonadales bacterium]|nr:MAG: hypothetical protein EOP61_06240 [Sphingomonadales bacterium]
METENPHGLSGMERVLSRPVPFWSLLLTILLLIAAAIAFGAIVDGWEKAGRLGRAAIGLARVPDTVASIFKTNAPLFHGVHDNLPGGFTRDARFTDTGYALISPFDPARGRSVVQLLRLSDGRVTREVVPDVDAANAVSRFTSAHIDVRRDKDAAHNRLMHPLLLADGGLVIHDSTPLARYDACGKLVWALDGIFHHSTEQAADGTLWVPYRYPTPHEPRVPATFWDDSLAHVTLDGKLIGIERVADILERNGLSRMWRSRPYADDPFHLNDIQPVLEDGRFWRRGDLFLSLRNLSLVLLYRPSTGRILWRSDGPWRFQHDVTILDDHRISVFDNNSLIGYPGGAVNGVNRLIVHDFASGTDSAPWRSGFERNRIATRAQGRGTPLPGGDAMIEETEQGRLLRIARDGSVRWTYISADSEQRRMALAWARYLSPQTDGPAIQASVNATCS